MYNFALSRECYQNCQVQPRTKLELAICCRHTGPQFPYLMLREYLGDPCSRVLYLERYHRRLQELHLARCTVKCGLLLYVLCMIHEVITTQCQDAKSGHNYPPDRGKRTSQETLSLSNIYIIIFPFIIVYYYPLSFNIILLFYILIYYFSYYLILYSYIIILYPYLSFLLNIILYSISLYIIRYYLILF